MLIEPLPWMLEGQVACNCAVPCVMGGAWVGGGGAGLKPLVVGVTFTVVGLAWPSALTVVSVVTGASVEAVTVLTVVGAAVVVDAGEPAATWSSCFDLLDPLVRANPPTTPTISTTAAAMANEPVGGAGNGSLGTSESGREIGRAHV